MEPIAPPRTRARVAQVVLQNTLGLRRGDDLLISAWDHVADWAGSIVVEARRLGIRPQLLWSDNAAFWRSLEVAAPTDLADGGPPVWRMLEAVDGFLELPGPEDLPRYQRLPEPTVGAIERLDSEWWARMVQGKVPYCRLEIGRATDAYARELGVDGDRWRGELVRATLTDPRRLAADAVALGRRLKGGALVEVSHPNGTRFAGRIARLPPFVDDGRLSKADLDAGWNFCAVPGGATLVILDEQVGDGLFVANKPSCWSRGGPLRGARWRFAEGRLQPPAFDEADRKFRTQYEAAPKGRDRPAFLVVGANPRLSLSPTLEDTERGCVCLGIGRNRYFGGPNDCPWGCWASLRQATVRVDGELLVRGGTLLL
jgi:hypothetical protein